MRKEGILYRNLRPNFRPKTAKDRKRRYTLVFDKKIHPNSRLKFKTKLDIPPYPCNKRRNGFIIITSTPRGENLFYELWKSQSQSNHFIMGIDYGNNKDKSVNIIHPVNE